MIDLKLAIILGSKLEKIRNLLEQIQEIHLGILINSLVYENKKEEKERKKEFFNSLKREVEKINKEVRMFNQILRFSFNKRYRLEMLPQINLKTIKQIIAVHKGDYKENYSTLEKTIEHILGEGDSPSSLSRKHTALKLNNVFLPLRISLGNFIKSLKNLEQPFDEYLLRKDKLRPLVRLELEKAKICYSVGLDGESVFIIGRLLENLATEYLLMLRKCRQFNASVKKIIEMDFDTKINTLYHKLKILKPNQYTKIMSVKWDRNILGHQVKETKKIKKDIEPIIKIGVNLVIFFEKKLKNA